MRIPRDKNAGYANIETGADTTWLRKKCTGPNIDIEPENHLKGKGIWNMAKTFTVIFKVYMDNTPWKINIEPEAMMVWKSSFLFKQVIFQVPC